MLEKDDIAQVYERVEAERANALLEQHELDKRIRAYDRVLSGYQMLYPDLRQDNATTNEGEKKLPAGHLSPGRLPARRHLEPSPRGQAAILTVMEDPVFSDRSWTAAEMTHELERRGWAPESENPMNAVRVALNRLGATHPNVHRLRRRPGNEEGGFRYRFSVPNETSGKRGK